ncbi:hypothetical protein YC2023_070655 [Brassica napus]
MDYERIGKTQVTSGGFSPGKLRTMLLGVDTKKKQEPGSNQILDLGNTFFPPFLC